MSLLEEGDQIKSSQVRSEQIRCRGLQTAGSCPTCMRRLPTRPGSAAAVEVAAVPGTVAHECPLATHQVALAFAALPVRVHDAIAPVAGAVCAPPGNTSAVCDTKWCGLCGTRPLALSSVLSAAVGTCALFTRRCSSCTCCARLLHPNPLSAESCTCPAAQQAACCMTRCAACRAVPHAVLTSGT